MKKILALALCLCLASAAYAGPRNGYPGYGYYRPHVNPYNALARQYAYNAMAQQYQFMLLQQQLNYQRQLIQQGYVMPNYYWFGVQTAPQVPFYYQQGYGIGSYTP
jgi:hypothetical protein